MLMILKNRFRTSWPPLCLCVSVALLSLCGSARGANADKPVSFHNDIRPIFNAQCNACHKPEKLKGELDMTTFGMLMKGGKHGATVVAGDPKKSKLVEMISGDKPDMPPDGDPLKKEQVALIERWIKEGAKDDTPAPGTTKIEPPTYTVPPIISAMAYSPGGKLLAVSGYREVLLHKADGSELVGRLVGESTRVESIATRASRRPSGRAAARG